MHRTILQTKRASTTIFSGLCKFSVRSEVNVAVRTMVGSQYFIKKIRFSDQNYCMFTASQYSRKSSALVHNPLMFLCFDNTY